jgi:hypothetical protein
MLQQRGRLLGPLANRNHHSFKERRRERDEKNPEQYTDDQAAALWLSKAVNIFDVTRRPWLRDLAKAYASWTAVANGSDLGKDDDPDRIPRQWNGAYFNLLARCLPGLTIPQIDDLALGLIVGLPGEAFLDVMTIFLRCFDDVYFNGTALDDASAVNFARRWRAVSWRHDNWNGSDATCRTGSLRIWVPPSLLSSSMTSGTSSLPSATSCQRVLTGWILFCRCCSK